MIDYVGNHRRADTHPDTGEKYAGARRVGMSAPAITERVQRLERLGVITGFRMEVDPAALGMPVTAVVRIRPGPGQLPKIAEAARNTPTGRRVPADHRQ